MCIINLYIKPKPDLDAFPIFVAVDFLRLFIVRFVDILVFSSISRLESFNSNQGFGINLEF